MTCEEVMELMQRELDGDLNEQEHALMEQHVARCPECAAMLARLRKLSDELEQLPRVVPRYSLVDAILPQLEQLAAQNGNPATADRDGEPLPARAERKESRAAERSRRWSRMLPRLAGVVALGVFVGVYLAGDPLALFRDGSDADQEAAMPESASNASGQQQQEALMFSLDAANKSVAHKSAHEPSADGAPDDAVQAPAAGERAPSAEPSAGGGGSGGYLGSGQTEPAAPATPAEPSATEGGTHDAPVQPGEDEGETRHLFSGFGATEWLSPDGSLRAFVADGSVQVVETADETKVVYVSPQHEGAIGSVVWNETGTALRYEWTDGQGVTVAYEADLQTGRETRL